MEDEVSGFDVEAAIGLVQPYVDVMMAFYRDNWGATSVSHLINDQMGLIRSGDQATATEVELHKQYPKFRFQMESETRITWELNMSPV